MALLPFYCNAVPPHILHLGRIPAQQAGFRPKRAPISMDPNITDGHGWSEGLH